MNNNGVLIKKIKKAKFLFHRSMFLYYMLQFNTTALTDLEGVCDDIEHSKFFISLLKKYLEATPKISIADIEEYTSSGLYGLDTKTMEALVYHMLQLMRMTR